MKRIIHKLPLNVSYYAQGTFLESEMYRSSPFIAEYQIDSPNYYNIPIYISFTNNHAIIRYKLNGNEINQNIKLNEWNTLNGFQLKINITDHKAIHEQTQKNKKKTPTLSSSTIRMHY